MIRISIRNDKLKKFIQIFKNHYQMANLSDGAVVISFYVLLSMFPLLIIVGNLFRLFNVDAVSLLQQNHFLLPPSLQATLQPIIISTLKGSSNGQLSFGIIITLWSASRAVAAFQRTVNGAYGIIKKPNAFFNRLTSFLWLTLIMILFGIVIAVATFGKFILGFVSKGIQGPQSHLLSVIQSFSGLASLIVLFILMNLLFYFIPSIKTSFKYTWQGSLIVTVGLMLLSQFFSLYVRYFMKSVDAYQTLSTFIILMFWLYFIGMILLFSAVLNASLQEYANGPIQKRSVDETINQKIKQRHLKK